MGQELVLCQPHFVRLSVRLWMECAQMEHAYDLQKQTLESIRRFIDPLDGGFGGGGWEIGTVPTVRQLLAYLKIRHPEATVSRLVMTARSGEEEYEVGDDLLSHVQNPFVMAVNGEHVVYVELRGERPL